MAALRVLPLVALWAGAALLAVAEALTLREIRAVTAVPPGGTLAGGSHHRYALALVAGALAVMAWGAVRGGSRPAAIACVALAVAACVVVLAIDRPALDDTGLIGRTYDLAEAHPGPGFAVEAVGAGLALVGAVAALALARPPRARAG